MVFRLCSCGGFWLSDSRGWPCRVEFDAKNARLGEDSGLPKWKLRLLVLWIELDVFRIRDRELYGRKSFDFWTLNMLL